MTKPILIVRVDCSADTKWCDSKSKQMQTAFKNEYHILIINSLPLRSQPEFECHNPTDLPECTVEQLREILKIK